MRLTKIKLIISFLAILLFGCGETNTSTKYLLDYESFEGDPTNTRIYTLKNGLKVYLSVNKDEPRIQTNIAVKAGSKYDPAHCTGLAHYLEHMLFKGNSKFGTQDWETEKKYLAEISDLFEKHKEAKDSTQKVQIYRQIDSLSLIASNHCLSNEYDKMVSSLGASGINAYTSTERTVYINEIPSNELEKWLVLESARFSELVLRLFHTELEVVYEEFNRGQDSDFRQLFFKIYEKLYPTHPYGTQTTIGKGEHLKNPSMVEIHKYFNKYYVPNNMCIALSGDLDYDKTIKLIDKHFGKLKSKKVPEFDVPTEAEITSSKVDSIYGPQQEVVAIAYRFPGVGSKESKMLQLVDGILNNGKAGLIDLNIMQKQKVLRASTSVRPGNDYSTFFMYGFPKNGQSLDEVSDLLFEQIELLKKGAFDDWLIEAIVNNNELSETKALESNRTRVGLMTESFISGINWNDLLNENDMLRQISKKEIAAFAKANFKDNYVLVKKLNGENKDLFKVAKPQITPVSIIRDEKSDFRLHLDTIETEIINPAFIDYKKEIELSSFSNNISVSFIKNKLNDLFELVYLVDVGTDQDPYLSVALSYLPYLGTSKYSPEELQKELFKYGLSFDASSSRDQVYITLSGISSSFKKGLELIEHIIEDAQPNQSALNELTNDIIKSRQNAKLNKGTILFSALGSYAKYGKKSPFTNRLSKEQLDNISPESLVGIIHKLFKNDHRVFLYGPSSDSLDLIEQFHKATDLNLEDKMSKKVYVESEMTENKVYFAHYNMVQTEIMLLSKDKQGFDVNLLPEASIFNQYFGSGLSSIIFQEIRESKALAYSSYCAFRSPSNNEESSYVLAYLGTQTDKLAEAVKVLLELMNDMPRSESQFEQAKESALKKISTTRITKSSIFWNYERVKKKGLDYDYREGVYEKIKTMTMDDLEVFFNAHIKGRNYTYLIIGDRNKVDFDALENLGKVEEKSLKEIFGY